MITQPQAGPREKITYWRKVTSQGFSLRNLRDFTDKMAQLLFKKPEEVDSHLIQLHFFSEACQPIYIVCFGDGIYLRGKYSKKREDAFLLLLFWLQLFCMYTKQLISNPKIGVLNFGNNHLKNVKFI